MGAKKGRKHGGERENGGVVISTGVSQLRQSSQVYVFTDVSMKTGRFDCRKIDSCGYLAGAKVGENAGLAI